MIVVVAAAAVVMAGCRGADAYYRYGRDAASLESNGENLGDAGFGRDGRGGASGGTGGRPVRPDAGFDGAGGAGGDANCAGCKLVVMYACSGPDANQIRAAFKVDNRSGQDVLLSDVTFRYWYGDIGAVAHEFVCDFAVVGKENITHQFMPVIPPRPGADVYVEIGFTDQAGTLLPFADTGEIRVRISRNDQQTITQTDDYSFDCSKISFSEWSHITVYERGLLVGGVEPPEKPAGP